MDAQFQRRMLVVCIGVLAFFCAIMAVLWRFSPATVMLLSGMACAVLLPLLLWRLWKLIRIFRNADQYIFFCTTLSAPKGNHKVLAFPVKVPGGGACWTDKIFYVRKFQPLLSDWLDQTVTVVWNRETDMVVVIGR